MKKSHHSKAKHHMAQAEKHSKMAAKHSEMAHKSMKKVGTEKEEKSMARKGDYKGNKAKKTHEAV